MDIFKRRDTFSTIALVVMLIYECMTITGVRSHRYGIITWAAIVLLVVCIVLITIGWCYRQYRFWPNTSIFTKLLSNAISPNWLGIVYLLVFVIHLGWLSDGCLFQSDTDTYELFVMLATGVVGILALVCFFPEGKVCRDGIKTKLFISGISNFQTMSPNRPPVEFSKFNLIPLISSLEEAWKGREKCEMLILKSDSFKDTVPALYVERADELRLNEIAESDYVAYGVEHTANVVDDKLRLIIKKLAYAVFYDHHNASELQAWIKDITIHFTPLCDYDNFPDCFSKLRMSLEKFDNTYEYYFNLSPGTAVVSAIMALLSIDDNSELYYYKQKNVTQRLQRVDKSKVPMENLLSQALETLHTS